MCKSRAIFSEKNIARALLLILREEKLPESKLTSSPTGKNSVSFPYKPLCKTLSFE